MKERTPSALIMEDDADWDVLLKPQLVEFAHGTRYLQGVKVQTTQSPYGDDWNESLRLGLDESKSCKEQPNQNCLPT